MGKTLLEVFPATEPEWLNTFKKVCVTGVAETIENYSVEMDMYFEIVAYVPQKGQMALIGSDITTRKKAEIAILENQTVLKQQNEEYQVLNEELNERNSEYAALNEKCRKQNKELKKAKQNTELMGGHIAVKSEKCIGSEFLVTLQLKK